MRVLCRTPHPARLSYQIFTRIAGSLWIDVEAKNLLDDRTMQDLFQYPLPGLSVVAIARMRL